MASADGVSAVAWTTTPWTIPSNQAVCVGSDIPYVLCRRDDGQQPSVLLVAATRLDALASALAAPLTVVGEPIRGVELTRIARCAHFVRHYFGFLAPSPRYRPC